jgi:hypothetical protein
MALCDSYAVTDHALGVNEAGSGCLQHLVQQTQRHYHSAIVGAMRSPDAPAITIRLK